MQRIEVLLADDNREFTNLLSEYISEQNDMVVTGVAYNGEEVLRLLEETRDRRCSYFGYYHASSRWSWRA